MPISFDVLLDTVFRSNPGYRLVPFSELSTENRATFQEIENHGDFYGMLFPESGSGLNIKSVCGVTARLFNELRSPSKLPLRFRKEIFSDVSQLILPLVMNGILEVKCEETFISGPHFVAQFKNEFATTVEGDPILQSSLSRSAIRYGISLDINDISALSARLYFYNRMPVGDEVRREMVAGTTVRQKLALHEDGHLYAQLKSEGFEHMRASPGTGWLSCRKRPRLRETLTRLPTYKLYISPHPDDFWACVPICLAALKSLPDVDLKIAESWHGVYRPDKFIVYFQSYDELVACVELLSRRLSGVRGHGVPFTAACTTDSLLSWGLDPPKSEFPTTAWEEKESWRLWITNRIANALVLAKSCGSEIIEPLMFATLWLEFEGVDTETWVRRKSLEPKTKN